MEGSVPQNRMFFLLLILSGPFRYSHTFVPLRNMRFCGTPFLSFLSFLTASTFPFLANRADSYWLVPRSPR